MRIPSLEEQKAVADYVIYHPLDRPDTDIRKAIKYTSIYIFITVALGLGVLFMLEKLRVLENAPKWIALLHSNHPVWFHILFFLFVFIITGACCLKPAVIGCVRLYQHYAPEGMRRRCLLKPTCSEYAILAVKKYGAIIGIYKTCVRLFVKCKGEIYYIDEP